MKGNGLIDLDASTENDIVSYASPGEMVTAIS